MDFAWACLDASRMETPRHAVREEQASIPWCSVPGCANLAEVRREIAEPLQWELGELEPFIVVTFLCGEHLGGVDAPEAGWASPCR
jgi:hypothetical protein